MAEIDITNDLTQINQQIEDLVNQLTTLNTQRDKLIDQIHNLNGIAMYLRGKQTDNTSESTPEVTYEYPPTESEEA